MINFCLLQKKLIENTTNLHWNIVKNVIVIDLPLCSTVKTGQRRVDPSAVIHLFRQRQNQTGNGQWAITVISEAEQRRKQYQAGVEVTSTGKAVRGQTQK